MSLDKMAVLFDSSVDAFTDDWGREWRKLPCGHWRNESHFRSQGDKPDDFCWHACHEEKSQ